MLVMLVVGLFTYRVILRSLGITDYGVYGVVSGVVTAFMLVMNTVTSAISRYITVGLGKGDREHLRLVFGTSLVIMAGFCLLIVVLTETAGLWYLNNRMVIPEGRLQAARVVLQTSMLVLMVNLMSVP
jgi:O-antigen/teichoic acid export membrane protein